MVTRQAPGTPDVLKTYYVVPEYRPPEDDTDAAAVTDAAVAVDAAVAAGAPEAAFGAGSGNMHSSLLCWVLGFHFLRPPVRHAAFHVGGCQSNRHRAHVLAVAGGALPGGMIR